MQELEEKFEEKFRFQLFHIPILGRLDKSLDVINALSKREWNASYLQPLVNFYSQAKAIA